MGCSPTKRLAPRSPGGPGRWNFRGRGVRCERKSDSAHGGEEQWAPAQDRTQDLEAGKELSPEQKAQWHPRVLDPGRKLARDFLYPVNPHQGAGYHSGGLPPLLAAPRNLPPQGGL